MKESIYCSLTTAINYIKKDINKYKNIENVDTYIKTNYENGFHIHISPAIIQKDGPSAGGAITCGFISKILGKNIKNNIGITGEIELTGKISKIGDLEYKLIGAKKSGIKIVYVPLENKEIVNEIIIKFPKLISKDFNIKFFENIDEIIDCILQ